MNVKKIIVIIIIVIIYVSINIVIIILALSIHLFYPSFNVIVVSVLPAFIVVVKPCTTCTLNDLVPCSIGINLIPISKRNLYKEIC